MGWLKIMKIRIPRKRSQKTQQSEENPTTEKKIMNVRAAAGEICSGDPEAVPSGRPAAGVIKSFAELSAAETQQSQ